MAFEQSVENIVNGIRDIESRRDRALIIRKFNSDDGGGGDDGGDDGGGDDGGGNGVLVIVIMVC